MSAEVETYKVAVGRAWVEIDFKAEAIYVRLLDTQVAHTREIGNGVLIDRDAAERLIGVEIVATGRVGQGETQP